ncbi:MAG: Minf_1886 family protein [bacterium]
MIEGLEIHLMDKITEVALANPRYGREAYLFLFKAINWATDRIGYPRHLSGEEFTRALIAYAREEFGDLAWCVFNEWGIFETSDFGKIVFTLIESGLMHKESEDSIEDFDDVLDIEKALKDPEFQPGIPF